MLEYNLHYRQVKRLRNINGTLNIDTNIDTFEVDVNFTDSINIEQLWKFLKRQRYKYYEKFADFTQACKDFSKHKKVRGSTALSTRRKFPHTKN
jgi:hypothetical protein